MADIEIKSDEIIVKEGVHKLDELTPKQKYLVAHMKDIEAKIATAKMVSDQHQMAKVACGNMLIDSFEDESK